MILYRRSNLKVASFVLKRKRTNLGGNTQFSPVTHYEKLYGKRVY